MTVGGGGDSVHAWAKCLNHSVLNRVSKDENHSACLHPLSTNSHPSLGT